MKSWNSGSCSTKSNSLDRSTFEFRASLHCNPIIRLKMYIIANLFMLRSSSLQVHVCDIVLLCSGSV